MTAMIHDIEDCFTSTATPEGASKWGELVRCPEAYRLRYERGITPVSWMQEGELDYFGVGSGVHGVLEWVNRGAIVGAWHKWRDAVDTLRAMAGTDNPDAEDVCDEVERLCDAYFAHYGTSNAGWPSGMRILAAEELYEDLELQHTGRADALLQAADRVVITDTKTRSQSLPRDPGCSSGHQEYARGAATVPQFLFLTHAVRQVMGLDYYPAMLINVVVKTKIPRFQRVVVDFSPRTVEMFIEAHRARVRLPIAEMPANLYACAPFIGRKCWAFDWCHGASELRDQRFHIEGT